MKVKITIKKSILFHMKQFVFNIDKTLTEQGFRSVYLIGSFDGVPDFLGYFFGVFLFFFITTIL